MNKVLVVYKPVGMTPLEVIHGVKDEFPEYKNVTMGYAGRLDPLARGVLLLMVGDATKERDTYLGLKKTYEFEVLFGVETDTYDVLGLIRGMKEEASEIVKEKVNVFVNIHCGTWQQSYPPYSSKPVYGKPLFWWARQNRLEEIQIPTREVAVYSFTVLSYGLIDKHTLHERIHETINNVRGDFRQDEIAQRWDVFFAQTKRQSFQTATFRLSCSSGTYVRGLAHELGVSLGLGAIALDIKRTHVGAFALKDALRLTRSR